MLTKKYNTFWLALYIYYKNSKYMNKKTQTFIEKARNVHGDKYDYSKVEYINAKTKICIICPIHGEFWQTPNGHLNGNGCKECARITISKKMSSNSQEFIERARKVHGDKYDYSKVEYINEKTKVCIICPIHGEFWQEPYSHLHTNGCKKCSHEAQSKARTINTEEFITRARKHHGNKYDYSKTNYTSYYDKVCIICPIHGEFWQLAYNHLQGKGCPRCKESKLEKEISFLLEENRIDFIRQYRPNFLKRGRGQLSLDFYLPKYKIAIECQGKQHFVGNTYYSRDIDKIVQRDKEKYKLTTENGISILYYSNFNAEYFGELFTDKIKLLERINNGE